MIEQVCLQKKLKKKLDIELPYEKMDNISYASRLQPKNIKLVSNQY